jgi:hypothetical protein
MSNAIIASASQTNSHPSAVASCTGQKRGHKCAHANRHLAPTPGLAVKEMRGSIVSRMNAMLSIARSWMRGWLN